MLPRQYEFIIRLMDMSPIAGVLHSLEGTVIYVNETMCDISGYSQSRFIGHNLASIFGRGVVKLLEASRRSQDTGKGCFRDIAILDASGKIMPMRALCLPLENESGSVTGVVCMMCRIEFIRQLELFYLQHLGRGPTDNYWILDDTFHIAYCQVDPESHFHSNEALGRNILDIIHPDHIQGLQNDLLALRKSPGISRRFRTMAKRKHRVERIEFDTVFVPDEAGDRYYIASRLLEPSGEGLVNRMMEAWGVETDAELAELLHVDPSTISRYRRNPARADQSLLLTYRSCGVSVEWLETGRWNKFISFESQ